MKLLEQFNKQVCLHWALKDTTKEELEEMRIEYMRELEYGEGKDSVIMGSYYRGAIAAIDEKLCESEVSQ